MKVIISGDHAGMAIRNEVKSLLEEMGIEYEDMGCSCESSVDYPDYGIPAAERVAKGEFDRGILVCGTGIGMSIAANKVKGIRCALLHDIFSAKLASQHNNANMIALGERVLGPGLAKEIVRAYLEADFDGGRHERRLGKIKDYEDKNL